jgi:hypothetical protein
MHATAAVTAADHRTPVPYARAAPDVQPGPSTAHKSRICTPSIGAAVRDYDGVRFRMSEYSSRRISIRPGNTLISA